MIGLPLRLLAREVYNRVVEKVGPDAVALITGEEKIKPRHPRYWVSTVEAMPRDLDVAFVAIDEFNSAPISIAAMCSPTVSSIGAGATKTFLLARKHARPLIERLFPGVQIVTRPRLSS